MTANATMISLWRSDIDSLAFWPSGHKGLCFVHRLAFRVLLRSNPDAVACEAYFAQRRAIFEAAAKAKIARQGLRRQANFHLTSRDIRSAF